jgi:predicted  nucleic acid-binding Zn-ribbon protein
MELELTPEQINQIVRAARVLAPGFSEEQLQWLVDCQRRLADSRFCEAAWGVARLERERGIICADTLDACDGLQQEKVELEAKVAQLKEKFLAQQIENREAEGEYRRIKEAAEQAKKELAEVKGERESEESDLVAFRKKAEKEKKRIDQEVDACRQKANVTEQEVAAARQLKAEVERCGFSLELMLGLSREFASYQDAREKLAEALKKHRTLTEYLAAMGAQAEEQKKALESELASLQSQRARVQAQAKSLEETRCYLESVIAQLQADVATEEELRRFYGRYHGVSGLMDCLTGWKQIFFLRCNNALSALAGVFDESAGPAHFWTDKPATRCPHCGLTMLIYDEKPYQALNCPIGAPLRLQLGE